MQRDYTKALAAIDLLPAEGKVDQNDFLPRALIRANILRLMGRRDQARSQYEEARRILESERNRRPEDARVHSALALALAGLGRADEALREGQLRNRSLPAVERRHGRSLQDRRHGTRRGHGRPV